MTKKLLILLLSVVLVICAFSFNVSAAEKNDFLSVDADVVEDEANKTFELKIVVYNNSSNALSDVCLTILSDYDHEGLTFSDSAYTDEKLSVVIDRISPQASGTYVFPLDSCSDKNAEVNVEVSYNFGDAEITAGKTSGKIEFESILRETQAKGKGEVILDFLKQSGFSMIAQNWKVLAMLVISFVLIYLAIAKQFEPLLLLPIAFGMLLTNLPGADMYHPELFSGGHVHWEEFAAGGGLLDYLYLGVKLGIYPCLIFLGIGAMTDFGPLIANPKSLLLGAAAQLGIFVTYFGAKEFLGFTALQASSIGIIGGADGPTAIYVTSQLAPELLGPIAVAAYSYMALVPVIQPPIMRALTTKKERMIKMTGLRTVSKKEKMLFPIAVTVFVTLLVPSAGPLVGCLMLGNIMRESGVVDRITKAAQNELMNIVTIFLGISVGATATAEAFLNVQTLSILALGIVAFSFGTAGGVLLAKFMNLFLKNKINPLIGSAGVSAVPMAARVSQTVGQKENPSNFLLMHAMGPNVAGVIGSAIAAGVLIALFG